MLGSSAVLDRRQALALLGASVACSLFEPSESSWAAARQLVIMHNEGFPPFEYNLDGRAVGLLPEKIDAIFGMSDEFSSIHRSGPWRRAQAMVRNGEADGLSAYPSPDRLDYAAFNDVPLESITLGIVFNQDHSRRSEIESISSLKDLRHFRVVDVFGNGWSTQKIEPIVEIDWVQSFDQVFEMLSKARADLHVVVSLKTAKWQFQHMGAKIKNLTFMPRPDLAPPIPLHFGLRRTLPEYDHVLRRFDELYDDLM